jgi:hypothetical protein
MAACDKPRHGRRTQAIDRNLRLGKAGDMHDKPNHRPHLTDAERIDRLRLICSDNVGPRGIMAQTPQAI